MSLYRARQAKLESREALVAKAGVDMEKRAEELRGHNQEALRSLAQERERLAEERTAFLLEKAEVEEEQRLAAEKQSAREGELVQRKVNLDSHEEELAAREQAIGGALKEQRMLLQLLRPPRRSWRRRRRSWRPISRRAARSLPRSSVSVRRMLPPTVSCKVFSLRGARSSAPPRIPMQISS